MERPFGGAERYLLDFALSLRDAGASGVRIIGFRQADLPTNEVVEGVKVERVEAHKWGAQWALAKGVKTNLTPDTLLVENMMSYCALRPLVSARKMVSIKHHLHSKRFEGLRRLPNWIVVRAVEKIQIAWFYRKASLIVVSDATQREWERTYPRFKGKMAICPPKVAKLTGKAHFVAPRRVMYLGSLNTTRKRVDHLIQAFRIVWQFCPDAELVVCGDGPDRTKLQRLAHGLPVRFTGWIPDSKIAETLATAWVFASPSTTEGFGITWVQANSLGIPVVGYNVGLDTVPEGCGTFVNQSDVVALGQAITSYLQDPTALGARAGDCIRNAARFEDMDAEGSLRALGLSSGGGSQIA